MRSLVGELEQDVVRRVAAAVIIKLLRILDGESATTPLTSTIIFHRTYRTCAAGLKYTVPGTWHLHTTRNNLRIVAKGGVQTPSFVIWSTEKTRPRTLPALAQNGQNPILTRWQDTRRPCRARTLCSFFGHGIGANGAAAKEGAT